MPTLKGLFQEANKLILVKYLVLARHIVLYTHLLTKECYTEFLHEDKIIQYSNPEKLHFLTEIKSQ